MGGGKGADKREGRGSIVRVTIEGNTVAKLTHSISGHIPTIHELEIQKRMGSTVASDRASE